MYAQHVSIVCTRFVHDDAFKYTRLHTPYTSSRSVWRHLLTVEIVRTWANTPKTQVCTHPNTPLHSFAHTRAHKNMHVHTLCFLCTHCHQPHVAMFQRSLTTRLHQLPTVIRINFVTIGSCALYAHTCLRPFQCVERGCFANIRLTTPTHPPRSRRRSG